MYIILPPRRCMADILAICSETTIINRKMIQDPFFCLFSMSSVYMFITVESTLTTVAGHSAVELSLYVLFTLD